MALLCAVVMSRVNLNVSIMPLIMLTRAFSAASSLNMLVTDFHFSLKPQKLSLLRLFQIYAPW